MGLVTLVNPRGEPVPPSAAVARLAAVSDRLTLKYVASYDGFGVYERWRSGDDRWQRVNTGELAPDQASDLLIWFPRGVSPDEIVSWVENRYGGRAYTDPAKAAEEMIQAERSRKQAAMDAQRARIVDIADKTRLTPRERRVSAGVEPARPMIYGADLA